MNAKSTGHVLGTLLIFLSVAMLIPIPVALAFGEPLVGVFGYPALGAFIVGILLFKLLSIEGGFGSREGFAIVAFGWISYALIGALPYYFSGLLPEVTSAIFEAVSGITTTGATSIRDVTGAPRALLFWGALFQWIGGMGIIVLSLAILPFLGIGGMQLFRAEVAGPTKDRLSSRIQDTAKLLWGVYVCFTLVVFVLYLIGGMSKFDAICHAFTTIATGGFSTYSDSAGHFKSPFIQWTMIIFMFLSSVNYSLHYYAFRGDFRSYLRREEFVYYVSILVVSVFLVFLLIKGTYDDPVVAFRAAAFQVVAIGTTTGYAGVDFEKWPILAQYILVLLMFIGGMAGSTSGGLKVMRVVLILKQSVLQVFRLIHPKGIKYLIMDREAVPLNIIQGIMAFFVLNICIFIFSTLLMAGVGLDYITAGSSVVSCLLNIGPGLGAVGPTDNYAHVPPLGKMVLSFCMMIGRLEVFTILILFIPSFWRK